MTDLTVMKIEAKRRYLRETPVSIDHWNIGGNADVRHEDCPEVDLRHVKFVTALGSISKSEDEASHQNSKIYPFEENTQSETGSTEKIII